MNLHPPHGAEEVQPQFVTVARLHRDEVNAAQHAFSMRATVPEAARFLGGAGVPGPPGADAVDILREGHAVVRVAHPEVHAMIRAAIAHADVPVLGDDGQVGLARHHAPRSSGASDCRTTELLRARAVADPAPVKSLPAVPRQPPHGDEPAPVTGIAVLGGAGASLRLPIDRLSVAAQRRVQRELQRVQDALDQPLPITTGGARPCRSGAVTCVPCSTKWSLTPP